MRKLVGERSLVDFSLLLADGRALPEWLVLHGTSVLTVKPGYASEIALRMDLVYTDGYVGRFDLLINAMTAPIKLRVKKASTLEAPRLFSEELNRDVGSPGHLVAA